MKDARPEDRVFELVLYLVTCALLTLDEPLIYGSFRLIEGADRLIEAAVGIPGIDVDDFLRDQKEIIEREKLRMINDPEGYRASLAGLATEFASEAVRRNLGDATPRER